MFRMLLSLTLLAIITAGAPTVVVAKAQTHPELPFDNSDIFVGVADLVEIKGGKPAGLRPKFNNAAKPKMAAPRTKPPVASRQAVKPRSATGRALPSRVQGVKPPAQTRGIIKKPTISAAVRHQKTGISSNARGLAKSPLTPKRIQQTRTALKEQSKHLGVDKNAIKQLSRSVQSTLRPPNGAIRTLNYIKEYGAPPKGFKGGSTFRNDGRNGSQVLPQKDGLGRKISYREYDIKPRLKGQSRGSQRIVIGTNGKSYYTSNHYKTFTPIE